MKRLLTIALILFTATCFAGDISTISGKAISGVATIAGKAKAAIATVGGGGVPVEGSSCAYDLCENFENPGYENSWSESIRSGDTIDPDNSSSPAPLVGSYSSRITTADDSTTGTTIEQTLDASDNRYVYFIINFDSLGVQSYRGFAYINGAGDTELCAVVLDDASNSATTLWDGAQLTGPGNATLVDTTYHYWLEYQKGTGSNGVCRVFRSTNSTKPGTPERSITNSARTQQSTIVGFGGKKNMDIVFDKIRISSSVIGSSPE